ncbi:hypothetical protein CLAIMM_06571 [Cladophialophora immunda]|nr:hypothetical protein CLAIMM_06571 [Cladophialophora immunda]
MAIKSLLFGGLLAIAVVCASADPYPDGKPMTTMATLVTRVAPPPLPTGVSPVAVTIPCQGDCDNVKANPPSSLPQPQHTCVREALIALANWRMHCDGGGIPPPKCWTRAPSVERCCGKWVGVNDEQYKDYPPVRTPKEVQTGETSWEWHWDAKVDKGRREVILQTVDEYHSDKTECGRWRAENEVVFSAFMQHLSEYNPEGGGYYDQGNPKYPSLQDGPPLGW